MGKKRLFFPLLFRHVSERAREPCPAVAPGTPLSSSARWEHLLPNGTDSDRAREESEGGGMGFHPTRGRGDVTRARTHLHSLSRPLVRQMCLPPFQSLAPSYLVFGMAAMPACTDAPPGRKSHRIKLLNLDSPIKKGPEKGAGSCNTFGESPTMLPAAKFPYQRCHPPVPSSVGSAAPAKVLKSEK